MRMSVIFKLLRVIVIKNTRSVANLQCRTYQYAAAATSSDKGADRVFRKKYQLQRFFCQSHQAECWHCKLKTKKLNHFICEECGKLQDISKEFDYFQLLSLPRDFDISATKLTKIFRQLQTVVHPDKFSTKSEREQANSAEWSALINKAYKTLSHPIVRGEYLLKLQGEEMPNDNSSMNKEFLMEMMEQNEEVAEANNPEDLNQINNKIQSEIDKDIVQLKDLFSSNNLEAAKEKLVKMKYLISIQSSIKAKLEKLMNR